MTVDPDPRHVPEDEPTVGNVRRHLTVLGKRRSDQWVRGFLVGIERVHRERDHQRRAVRNLVALIVVVAIGMALCLGFLAGQASAASRSAAQTTSHAGIQRLTLWRESRLSELPTGTPLDPVVAQHCESTGSPEVGGCNPSHGANGGVPSHWPTLQEVRLPRPRPSIEGTATWYCRAGISRCHFRYPDTLRHDLYAAAGPDLRAAIGPDWRGKTVRTCSVKDPNVCVAVRLIDWCACGGDHVIDLYWDAFAFLADRASVNPATVSW